MNKVKIIFYKAAKGNWKDKLISLWTLGKYSHCEILYDGFCYSSSGPDNGVRKKEFVITDEWDILELSYNYNEDISKLHDFYNESVGSKYDWIGLFFKFILNKEYPNKKYYCSEWCAICLNNIYNIRLKTNISPSDLYNLIKNTRQ